jgi:hypothetical protein
MRTHLYRNLPYNMNPNEGYIHCSNNAVENMLRTHWEHIGNKEKTPKKNLKKKKKKNLKERKKLLPPQTQKEKNPNAC